MEGKYMVKVYGTNAEDFVHSKLGFVAEFSEGVVEVRIKTTKANDLRVASINYKLKGHPKPTYIESGEHRSVAKSVQELSDIVSEKIARDQDKYEARKRRRRQKAEQERLKQLEELENARLEKEFEVSA